MKILITDTCMILGLSINFRVMNGYLWWLHNTDIGSIITQMKKIQVTVLAILQHYLLRFVLSSNWGHNGYYWLHYRYNYMHCNDSDFCVDDEEVLDSHRHNHWHRYYDCEMGVVVVIPVAKAVVVVVKASHPNHSHHHLAVKEKKMKPTFNF